MWTSPQASSTSKSGVVAHAEDQTASTVTTDTAVDPSGLATRGNRIVALGTQVVDARVGPQKKLIHARSSDPERQPLPAEDAVGHSERELDRDLRRHRRVVQRHLDGEPVEDRPDRVRECVGIG